MQNEKVFWQLFFPSGIGLIKFLTHQKRLSVSAPIIIIQSRVDMKRNANEKKTREKKGFSRDMIHRWTNILSFYAEEKKKAFLFLTSPTFKALEKRNECLVPQHAFFSFTSNENECESFLCLYTHQSVRKAWINLKISPSPLKNWSVKYSPFLIF